MLVRAEMAGRMTPAFLGLVFTATACAVARVRDDATEAAPSGESADATIEVVAEVLDFERAAMWEHYEGGGFTCFAGTRVRFLSPADLTGKDLSLLHSNELPADSPWRRKGARLRFSLPWDGLHPEPGTRHMLFAEAFKVENLSDRR